MKQTINILCVAAIAGLLLIGTSAEAQTCSQKAYAVMNQAAANRAAVNAPMTKDEYQRKLKALLAACRRTK